MKNCGIIFFFLLLSPLYGQPDTALHRLELEYKNAPDDSVKINALLDLAVYFMATDLVKASSYAEDALARAENKKFITRISNAHNILGSIHFYTGNYDKAAKNFLKALNIYESQRDSFNIANSLNNIASVYVEYGSHGKALEYHLRALKIRQENYARGKGKLDDVCMSYTNLGKLFFTKEDYPRSLEYFQKGLSLAKILNKKEKIALLLNNIGGAYGNMDDYDNALKYFEQALPVHEELGNKQQLAMLLCNIGELYSGKRDFAKALSFYEKSLLMAQQTGSKDDIKMAYAGFFEVYKEKGDYRKAYEYHKRYCEIKDSLLNEESSEQIAEMQTKYESEKKQKEIELLNKEKELQNVEIGKKDAEVKKQNTQKIVFGAGFGLVLLLALVIFRGYKQKEKNNLLLARQKQQIEIKNSHLEYANTEISKQKNEIEEKNHEILASIRYAQRIQQAILPPGKLVKQHLDQSFILYKPKDIVAGDFYWMKVVGGKILFAACDCTGHGVPGAFVSIVGHNALNRAVKEFGLTKPSLILDKVNELVQETFSKSENQMKDGMDIALCSLEFVSPEQARLQYAGANNSMYIISNGELKEVKADKQPIGHFIDSKPFSNHEISLKKSDSLFVFTDGYADQFGGPKGKKFKYSQFEKLLVSMQDKPMSEQRNILNQTIDDWRGELEQIDDICIIGVKI